MDKNDDQDNSPIFDERPWGSFTVLDEAKDYKVKRLEILPRKRLSYQRHTLRAEHWYVVRGIAKVTLNGTEILLKTGESLDVATGDAHRIENPHASETLVLIEAQTGSYFGEDDIERLDDDFGRLNTSGPMKKVSKRGYMIGSGMVAFVFVVVTLLSTYADDDSGERFSKEKIGFYVAIIIIGLGIVWIQKTIWETGQPHEERAPNKQPKEPPDT
jgi:mannose-6-phosphate isomerase